MSKPIIFCIDDDVYVLRALVRDLKNKYRDHYRVLSTTTVKEGLASLLELKNTGEIVAMYITDQRMPEMDGITFLEQAIKFYPDAKRLLLTAYSDTDAAIKAINVVQLDYFLVKPWEPPEEKLYPVIDGLLDAWLNEYHPDFKGIKVFGYQYSQLSHQIKDFLAGNLIPYRWIDIQASENGETYLQLNKLSLKDLPVIFFDDGSFLVRPGIVEIASKIGLSPELKNEVYDVVIIGAGPAGLAAGVYGASEGLKTLLIERHAPGGQAGTSSRIENYLGFPSGISGAELTRRSMTQVTRLGTEFLSPRAVNAMEQNDGYKKIILDNGSSINTRSIIITTGVDYKQLEVPGISSFTGAGIYYGAAVTEAAACMGKDVYIVGGGNSAGQAAMYLSRFAKTVFILIRKADLASTMSAYLIDQVKETPNIYVKGKTIITEAKGSDRLEYLILQDLENDTKQACTAAALYIFIGARPFTDWIQLDIIKDDKGFLETGRELKKYDRFAKIWKEERDPYLLETSCPGVFAAGDVRSGAMNRVAAAVGEGSMAISFVHRYLAEVK